MPNCPRIMLTVPVLRRAKYEADPLFLAGEKDNWAVWQLVLLLFYQSTKRLKEKLSQWIHVYKSCPFYQTCVRSSHWDSRRGWIVWRKPAYFPLFFTFWKKKKLFEKGYILGQIKFSKCHYLPLLCDRICQNNRGWNGLSGIWMSYEKGVLRCSWYSNANFAQILSGRFRVKQSACVHNL